MKKTKTVPVGWVQKTHGLSGEIYVRLHHPQPDWLGELRCLTLRSPQGFASSHSLSRVRPHKKGLILDCEDIENRNQAETFRGYSVEIPQDILVVKKGEMYLNEVLHFDVVVKDRGTIGRVESFTTHKIQDLLVVQSANYHYEIPFVDDYINKICKKSAQIHMELPEGLLELYEV